MYDAIVLAGGAARRLGGIDKVRLEIGGATLLERVLAAVDGAERVVVVGPQRAVAADVTWCLEDPPGGGPVAAVAAALPHTSAPTVVLLAADLPWVAPAVPALVTALAEAGADAALLADAGGRVNHLAAAWQRGALLDAVAALGAPAGASMRTLLAAARTQVLVPDPAGWGRDCDTWDDLAAARDLEANT